MIRLTCSVCEKAFKVDEKHAGRTIACPACKEPMKVPSSGPANAITERLTSYADSIPHHGISNFGSAISIKSIETIPVFSVHLSTGYEIRDWHKTEKPYDGRSVPPLAVTEDKIDVWAFAYPEATEKDARYIVDGSQQVRDCLDCGAQGIVTCNKCQGAGTFGCEKCGCKGKVACHQCGGAKACQCPTCSGTGACSCQRCSGTGQLRREEPIQRTVECHRCIGGMVPSLFGETTNVVCWICNGKGWYFEESVRQHTLTCPTCGGNGALTCGTCVGYQTVPCQTCNAKGKLTCPKCEGEGHLTCSKCKRAGHLTCSTCEGCKQLISYLVIRQSYEKKESSDCFLDSACPEKAIRLLRESDYNVISKQLGSELCPDVDLGSDSVPLSRGFRSLQKESQAAVAANKHIIKQRLRVRQATVQHLRYTYKKEEYELWLVGHDEIVCAPKSPITRYVSKQVSKALEHWNGHDQVEATECLRIAEEMGQNDPNCQAIIESAEISAVLKMGSKANQVFSKLGIGKSLLKLFPTTTGGVVVAVCLGVVLLLSLCCTVGIIGSAIERREAEEAKLRLEAKLAEERQHTEEARQKAEQARQRAKQELADANRLWAKGDKLAAVTKYKALIQRGDTFGEGPTIFERVIEFEAKQGNTSAAKEFIEKAQKDKIALFLAEPKAKEIAAQLQKERQEQEALALAQKKKQNESPKTVVNSENSKLARKARDKVMREIENEEPFSAVIEDGKAYIAAYKDEYKKSCYRTNR